MKYDVWEQLVLRTGQCGYLSKNKNWTKKKEIGPSNKHF